MEPLVARAASTGADVVLLPEKWNATGKPRDPSRRRGAARGRRDGRGDEPLGAHARDHARRAARSPSAARGARSSRTPASSSTPRARSRPSTGRSTCSTSRWAASSTASPTTEEPGDEPVGCEVEGWRVGLTVCYDVRFPELYRILAVEGAELLHRARRRSRSSPARITGSCCSAPARSRTSATSPLRTSGAARRGQGDLRTRSIVDPWGVVLAQAPDEDAVVSAELDRAHLERIRAQRPVARQPPARRVHVAGGGLGEARRSTRSSSTSTSRSPSPVRCSGRRATASAGGAPRARPSTRSATRPPARRRSRISSTIPELEHDEEIWVRFTEDIVRGMGGEGPRAREVALAIIDGWEHSANFELYEDVLPVLARAAARRACRHRPRLEHEPRPRRVRPTLLARASTRGSPPGVHGKVKPSPTIFLAVLDLLGVEAAAAVMVGDSLAGRRRGRPGARDAGLPHRPRGAVPGARADALPTLLALPAARWASRMARRARLALVVRRRAAAACRPAAPDLDPRPRRLRPRLVDHDRRRLPAAAPRGVHGLGTLIGLVLAAEGVFALLRPAARRARSATRPGPPSGGGGRS